MEKLIVIVLFIAVGVLLLYIAGNIIITRHFSKQYKEPKGGDYYLTCAILLVFGCALVVNSSLKQNKKQDG